MFGWLVMGFVSSGWAATGFGVSCWAALDLEASGCTVWFNGIELGNNGFGGNGFGAIRFGDMEFGGIRCEFWL